MLQIYATPAYASETKAFEIRQKLAYIASSTPKIFGVTYELSSMGLSEHRLRIRQTYTDMNYSDLDGLVRCILREFPNAGYKKMTGFLLARGIRLQQSRIRSAMQRVNPEGCLLRSLELNVLHRRSYQVYGPLALWHLDGNHKLIR